MSTVLCIVMHFSECCDEEDDFLESVREGSRSVRFSQDVTVHIYDSNKGTVKIMLAKILQENFFSVPYLSDPYFVNTLSHEFLLVLEWKYTCIQSICGAVTIEVRML